GVLAGLVVIGRRLGFTPLDTIVGILGVSLSASMLYTFHNPYLTDMFGLAAVVAALVALLARKPLVFAAIVTLGSAGREVVVFIAPAYLLALWCTRDRRRHETWGKLGLALALPVAAILVPRLLPVFGDSGLARYGDFYATTLLQWEPLRRPAEFLLMLGLGWHWLWIVGAAGLFW